MKILTYGEILFDEIDGEKHLGGAPLNLAAHLASLGAEVYLVSAVGEDKDGQAALKRIRGLNIRPDFIGLDREHSTGLVKVIVNKEGSPTFNIVKEVAYDYIELGRAQKDKIRTMSFDCIYFGTLAQRSHISRQTLYNLLDSVTTKQIFYDINIRENNYSEDIVLKSLGRSTILKTNEEEAEYLIGLLDCIKPDYNELSIKLREDYGIEILIITRGEYGCLAYSRDRGLELPGIKVKVVDTVGAGDAFSAGFMYKYLKTNDLKKACITGVRMGAKIVGQAGAI